MIKGEKIDGLLTSLPVGTDAADINETVCKLYGGGVYRIKLVEDDGRLLVSHTIWIHGLPMMKCDCPLLKMMNRGCHISWHK